ncbi:MAG: MOSC N-terminal beta barrel domain-containing protein [Ignavibacteriaceae bacterium]
MLTLSEIYIYPIKSLGGISLDSAIAEDRGLKYDRRYLLVDENGMFLTQRDLPQLALLKLSFTETGFKVLNMVDNSFITIPFESDSYEKMKIQIWDDNCNSVRVDKKLDEWFSNILKIKCSLVYMPDNEKRIVEKKFFSKDFIVSFADAYPYLIIGQSSLDDLNSRLETGLPMNRFRPNFVFSGGNPYEEDNWKNFKIDGVHFKAVKPCARCMITTTDQETAERSNEPLKTLSTYRKIDGKVMFGMNLVCIKRGIVSIGDEIEFN